MKRKQIFSTFFLGILSLVIAGTAFAAGGEHPGTAHWGGFPQPAGPIAEHVTDIYNFIYYITLAIAILVEGLIIYIIWQYRASKRKQAAKFSHNTMLEVVWTTIPAIICVAIAWQSFVAMEKIRTFPEEGMDVEVIAYQFGWSFDYPDLGISAPEPMESHKHLSSAGVERYVKDMVVPVDTVIKLHVTAQDVIHSFYAADAGIKIDAIPGRINYQWFEMNKEGEFIGQCAELCGAAHGEMFFTIKVVSKEEFKEWANEQRAMYGMEKLDNVQLTSLLN